MAKNRSPEKSAKPKKSNSLLEQALRYLSFRARSEKEMQDYLRRKGHAETQIQAEVESLKELKLIDDVQFAQAYIESRSRSHPRSRRLLELELKHKGVDASISSIQYPIFNDLELARSALEKKHNIKSRDQAIRFLQSRGFSWEIIAKVLKLAGESGLS